MAIQRSRVELGQNVDFSDIAVNAVADRDVNQAVVGSQRYSGLCSFLCEGVKSGTSSTSKDYAQNTL